MRLNISVYPVISNSVIRNLKEAAMKRSLKLPDKDRRPVHAKFVPELDRTPEVDSQHVKFYQELARCLASLVSFVHNLENKMKFNIYTYVGTGRTYIQTKLNKKSQKCMHK